MRTRYLFSLILLLEAVLTLIMMFGHRIPDGHDGFQYFYTQYYFLNTAAHGGGVAQWMPYLTHGTIATWWYTATAGLSQSVFIHLGSLISWTNPTVLFHFNMFVDEVLFLTGMWLFCRRFFIHTQTVYYVCVCAMGSCIWVEQPWYNFHFYYAIPLILYLLHYFLDTGRWRFFLAAFNLLAVQTLGNLPYFIPMASFIIFSYFLFYSLLNFDRIGQNLRGIRWNLKAIVCIAIAGAGLYAAYYIVGIGTDQIANHNFGRNSDGTVALSGFLTYADNQNLLKWHELWLGISPCPDYTIYIGMMSLPLIVCGLYCIRRCRMHFVLWAAVILAISLGFVPLGTLLYNVWPGMQYYRHLTLVSPFVKLNLCIIAGIGFEHVFMLRDSTRPIRLIASLVALVETASAAASLFFAIHPNSIIGFISSTVKRGLPTSPMILDSLTVQIKFELATASAIGAALIFGVRALRPSLQFQRHSMIAALVLITLDMYAFKFVRELERTDGTNSVPELTSFQSMPFAANRQIRFPARGPRVNMLNAVSRQAVERYWSVDNFTWCDEAGNAARTDHWLRPLDRLMKAYWRQPVLDESAPPKGLHHYQFFIFPLMNPSAKKVIGAEDGKIQFFDKAWDASSDLIGAQWLTNPDFKGDGLILTPSSLTPIMQKPSPTPALAENHKLHLEYQIRHFDSNNLVLSIQNPTQSSVWLLYCDCWHPDWTATVNGAPAPIQRADLAYKAVKIPPGADEVHLAFSMPRFAALAWIFTVDSAIWLIILTGMVAGIVRPRPGSTPRKATQFAPA